MDEAILALQREVNALGNMANGYRRKMQIYPENSPDWLGAKQALDVVTGRIEQFQAGIAVLQAHELAIPVVEGNPQ